MMEYQVSGKVVISSRRLWICKDYYPNSKSQRHPNGLANSSNVIGKYLHDSTGAALGGYLPTLFGKRYNEDGVGGLHVYSPWWLDNKKLDFPTAIISNTGRDGSACLWIHGRYWKPTMVIPGEWLYKKKQAAMANHWKKIICFSMAPVYRVWPAGRKPFKRR